MQTRADLRLLQLAEIGFRLVKTAVESVRVLLQLSSARDPWPVQILKGAEHLGFQHLGALTTELSGFHQFIQQSLKFLKAAVQTGAAQGWGEVIQHHRMAPAFGLGSLPWVVDDEGVEMRQGTKGEIGATGRTETHPFARQPFSTAVLAHMHHHLAAVDLSQPQVLSQVAVRWRQVRRMQISDLIRVIAPIRLQQHHQMAIAQTMNGKPTLPIEITGLLRLSPAADDPCFGLAWNRVPPGLVGLQRQVIKGGAVTALG